MPGAAVRMQPTGVIAVVVGLVMKLVIGIIVVWLYAAARPALGGGWKTADLVALTVWALGAIFFSDFPLTGMISWTSYAGLELLQLAAFLGAAMVAAWQYRHQPSLRVFGVLV